MWELLGSEIYLLCFRVVLQAYGACQLEFEEFLLLLESQVRECIYTCMMFAITLGTPTSLAALSTHVSSFQTPKTPTSVTQSLFSLLNLPYNSTAANIMVLLTVTATVRFRSTAGNQRKCSWAFVRASVVSGCGCSFPGFKLFFNYFQDFAHVPIITYLTIYPQLHFLWQLLDDHRNQ